MFDGRGVIRCWVSAVVVELYARFVFSLMVTSRALPAKQTRAVVGVARICDDAFSWWTSN
jgi:hypothetical protein